MKTKFIGKKIDWASLTQDDFKELEKEWLAVAGELELKEKWFDYVGKQLNDIDNYLLDELDILDEDIVALIPQIEKYEDWKQSNNK